MSNVLRLLLLAILLGGASAADQPGAQAAVQAAYDRAALGASLKYVYGMLSHRSSDFELFDREGKKIDLTLERDRFKLLLGPATRVQLSSKILSFQAKPGQATCRVQQILSIEAADPDSKSLVTTHYRSDLQDLWMQEKGRWRLRACSVVDQSLERQPGALQVLK